MKFEMRLPELGEDAVQSVTVSGWMADLGARIEEGDDLLEITTDKAAFCVPAPQKAVLVEQLAQPGDEIQVGDVICVLEI